MKKIKYLVIHCSATPPSMDVQIDDIRRWHVEDNGWSDVGYHLFITRQGNLQTGRPINKQGAHVRGYNDCSIGICLAGSENNFTDDQFITLRKILTWLELEFPGAKILGHRDFPGVKKSCPGFDVADWLSDFKTTKKVD